MTEPSEDDAFGHEPDVDVAAAQWLLRLSEASLADEMRSREEFERWRTSDPKHAESFARISKAWDAIGSHSTAPEIAALRQGAREELEHLRGRQSRKRIFRWAVIGGLELTAAAAVLAYILFWPVATLVLTTPVGQTKTVELDDRSTVEIDADSSVSVEFDRNTRLVRVLRGQAYFQVAKHQVRPFVVECHGRSVVATGTAFDVEALPSGLHVTLVEGHVQVRASGGTGGPLLARLEPGDSLTTQTGASDELKHQSNLVALLAWRTGHLMFDDMPLADAVARMGRYVHQRIAVDPSVASIRISGVFAAGDMNGMLEAVEAYYPVAEMRESDGGIRLTRRS